MADRMMVLVSRLELLKVELPMSFVGKTVELVMKSFGALKESYHALEALVHRHRRSTRIVHLSASVQMVELTLAECALEVRWERNLDVDVPSLSVMG